MDVDLSAFFGNKRSKRYAIIVEDGKVKKVFAEPDNTSVNGESIPLRVHTRKSGVPLFVERTDNG